jgi:hypothetical protein
MPTTTEKRAERRRKAKAYREMLANLADISALCKPTSSSIFACLSEARLKERSAESSWLTQKELLEERRRLLEEDPRVPVPEELSDEAAVEYLADAGDLYGSAATDYLLIADPLAAFKYYRKAFRLCRMAADMAVEDRSGLSDKAQEYKEKTAVVRLEVASRSMRRRRFSLGLLGRLR